VGREFLSDLRLESAIPRVKQYLDMICVNVAIKEILDPLILVAYTRKLAQSYIDKFRIEKSGFIKVDLVNDHHVSRYLEYGTEPHTISGNLNFDWKGEDAFFQKVNHPGFDGYGLLEDVLENLSYNYAVQLSKEGSAYLERVKMK